MTSQLNVTASLPPGAPPTNATLLSLKRRGSMVDGSKKQLLFRPVIEMLDHSSFTRHFRFVAFLGSTLHILSLRLVTFFLTCILPLSFSCRPW